MRKALVAVSLLSISVGSVVVSRGCTDSYVDLREPIYLVIDPSLFTGCEYDPEKEEDCRESRIKKINDGADEWFKHFAEATRPKVEIVYSEADLPLYPINDPIYIKVKKNYCGVGFFHTIVACYEDASWALPVIVFVLPENIDSRIFAHELGHAFDRGHWDTPENVYSVMSYNDISDHVLPIDIKLLCKTHRECPPHEDTWCEGGFWDKERCPSSSYEEGQKTLEILKSVLK
jgi:hypothetical protein